MKHNHKLSPPPFPAPRRGFSLIELLIVIVIIGILMALIIPTLSGVRNTAAVVEQSAEFSKLDTAITQFKSDMGVEPWSEIVLTENPGSTPWDPVSMTKIRRIWPTFDFTAQIDFNADGVPTGDPALGNGTITLTGSECLVFFLAGVLSRDSDGNGVISPVEATGQPTHVGFSKNPVNPFSMTGSNRQGPWFTFDAGRLRLDSLNLKKDLDGDGMPEYFPTLGEGDVPVHFASANNGQGYYSGVAIYVQADGRTPWNKDSHQLMAAGFDGKLGFDSYLIPGPAARLKYANAESLTGRPLEVDNVTNFKQGSTLGD